MKNKKDRTLSFDDAFAAAIRDFARDMSGKQAKSSKPIQVATSDSKSIEKDHEEMLTVHKRTA